MKRIYTFMLTSMFSVLLLAAAFSVRPACAGWTYQPELPKSLRK
ncbi:MAG TPA: cyclic lactone autoinducer peptide [Bacillota bacterium]|nr:cyclic lactone autoinducer peptide [Bacillota bacterium]